MDGDEEPEALREPVLDAARHEIELRSLELELKRAEIAAARGQTPRDWRNPLVVAVLAAAVAAAGNALVTFLGGTLDRRIAAEQASDARILKMIETGDPDQAAENLAFLLDAGLVTNPETAVQLRAYLDARERGTGPSLAAPATPRARSIVGEDDAVEIGEIGSDLAMGLGRAVGRVGGSGTRCNGFLVAPDRIVTGTICVQGPGATFLLGAGEELRSYAIDASARIDRLRDDAAGGYSILPLARPVTPAIRPLRIAQFELEPLSHTGLIYHRAGEAEQLAVWDVDACRLGNVSDDAFEHSCDTGHGTMGAPVFDIRTGGVVGMHHSWGGERGYAYRLAPLD